MLKGDLSRRERDEHLERGEHLIRALAVEARPDDPEGQQAIVDRWLGRRKGAGRPKKLQKQMLLILGLQMTGATNEEIAKALGFAKPGDVSRIRYRAKRDLEAFDMGIASRKLRVLDKVWDNVVEAVHSDNEERKDKFTLEALKGLGEFRSHSAVKQEGAAGLSALVVQIKMPELPDGHQLAVSSGQVVGRPRAAVAVIEGEVVNGQ